ncbi:MAG: hypothetical protein J0M15_02040 [Deltaproteobacteria bacterium]|nr:hypothetical protein [Deltaproteobacteria bacterium]
MAKGNMVFIGTEKLRQLFDATGLKGMELERLFNVSHAGFYKWQSKGIIPSDKLGHLLVLNKFGGYEIEANPTIRGESNKTLDFRVKDFFNRGEHLYVESKPSDENLEAVRVQMNTFKVPVTLLYLSKGEIKMEENASMRQRLSTDKGVAEQHLSSKDELGSASLDDLIQEIEKRGWLIKLERKSSLSTDRGARSLKKLRNR